jgi:hypothetical protein
MTSDSINRSCCNGKEVGVVIEKENPFDGLVVGVVVVCKSSCLYVCLSVHSLVILLTTVWCRAGYHFICLCLCQVVVGLFVGFL